MPVQDQTLFISDLHISIEKPEITRRFLRFLQQRAKNAQALYILGDLFDAWVGDDDYTPPGKQIRLALKQLTAAGVKIYLQTGNRDFLLGQRFCAETGVSLLTDYHCFDLYGTPTLLTHGDLLCTDDHKYQEFRELSRSTQWQQNVLGKPLLIRLLAARWYRFRSFFHKRKQNQEIMDVNQQTVADVMQQHQVTRLIHGHTHRPAVHELLLNQQTALRIVLADWKKHSGSVLCFTPEGFHTEQLD